MKSTTSILCFLILLIQSTDGSEWVSLFDGKTLNGWRRLGNNAVFQVRDGEIVGLLGDQYSGIYLYTEKQYSDFELEYDVFLEDSINSGVQIRSKIRDITTNQGKKRRVIFGPQVEIELSPGQSGYLFDQGGGDGWMHPKKQLKIHDIFRNGQWNHYRVVTRGPRIQTYVNGTQVSDIVDKGVYKTNPEGIIALQVYQRSRPSPTMEVRWKNIRIRETDTEGWISLFDGKALKGWTPKIKGYELGKNPGKIFRVKRGSWGKPGVLKVSYDNFKTFEERFGHLFYKTPYSFYKFRMEYRFVGEQSPGGPDWAYRNSGVMIHGQSTESMEKDQSFPNSIEVQLLGADEGKVRTTGNLCTPGTKFYKDGELIEKHCIDSNSQSYAGDQWVQMEIHVYGSKEIVHLINGKEVLRYQLPQLDDGTLLDGGTISLQAESHGCEFRNIEIKPLD